MSDVKKKDSQISDMEVRVAVNEDEDDDVIGFDDKNVRGRPKFKVRNEDQFETCDRDQIHSS